MSILGRPKLLKQLVALMVKPNQQTPRKSELAADLNPIIEAAEGQARFGSGPILADTAATLRIARYVIDAEELETI